MLLPYIGVTGFTNKAEVSAALDTFDSLPDWGLRMFMVGVLASSKTLAGKTNKWPNRYPHVYDIATLFPPHRRTLNLIHYSTDDRQTLHDQLRQLMRFGGMNLDGFQLNICWPEPSSITMPVRAVPTEKRVVLQLGRGALEEMGNNPEAIAKRLDAYRGLITDVLVDASGGRGIPMDLEPTHSYVRAISTRHPHFRIGVAGGLSSQTIGQLKPLTRHNLFPRLSVDAEGRLRTAEDHLDVEAMKNYISAVHRLFDFC